MGYCEFTVFDISVLARDFDIFEVIYIPRNLIEAVHCHAKVCLRSANEVILV